MVSSYVASRIKRTRKDFRIDTFRAGGNGGQRQNKVDSGVRITDLKTGLSVDCREERDQHTNKKRAFHRLVKKLIGFYEKEELSQLIKEDLGVIRTYKLTKGIIVDNRTNLVYDANRVLNGHLEIIHQDLLNQRAGDNE